MSISTNTATTEPENEPLQFPNFNAVYSPQRANTPDLASPCMARVTRHYTPREKQEALLLLAQCHGNCREAGRIANIPWTTLRGWSQQMPHAYAKLVEYIHQHQPDLMTQTELPAAYDPTPMLAELQSKADLIIAAITPERLADAKLPQLARALAAITSTACRGLCPAWKPSAKPPSPTISPSPAPTSAAT